ncbi:MAG: polyprenyl synthetase family protein [Chthoniobacterales bacterium]
MLSAYLQSTQRAVDAALKIYLPPSSTKPATIHQAMRYSIFAGGKRLRPILCIAAAEACGGRLENALPAACAVEMVHTYSLIHDDLPAMDNDDFRRGKPTNHKVYGEAIAILAGDALLTLAFEVLAAAASTRRYSIADQIRELAQASGSRALIAGQVADLEAEGKKNTVAQLRYIHGAKTAALLTSSIRLGAISANATDSELVALTTFAENLGLAFQVIDDILDVTQTSEKLGKSAGKDVTAQKATYPAILGLDKSRKEAHRLTDLSLAALEPFGQKADRLRTLSGHLLQRDY